MNILTIDALHANLTSVLTRGFPENPSRLLLLNAQIAATCLRQMASEDLDDARDLASYSDAFDRWREAHQKTRQIIGLLETLHGVPELNFWLMRPKRRKTIREWCWVILRKITS